MKRFRGYNLGRRLLEHCYRLAESRGCNVLYSRAAPTYVKYLEKQGWRCLEPAAAAGLGGRTAARVRSVDLAKPWPELDAIDALTLSQRVRRSARALPGGTAAWSTRPPFRRGGDAAGTPGVVA
jgi:hypothetical protein